MKSTLGLLGAGALLLAACNAAPPVQPVVSAGGSAASEGPGYCDAPPTDVEQLSHWNQLCSPGGRR